MNNKQTEQQASENDIQDNRNENPMNQEDENVNQTEESKNLASENQAESRKSKTQMIFHILLIAAIIFIAVFSVYRLYKWNLGTPEDPNEEQVDPSQFDIESLDMIIPMDSSLLEGHVDDGETTILCLGNNPFADDHGDAGLAAKIAKKTNATVYDCSFPESSAACKYAEYNPEYTKDQFNLYYVVECFRNNEFRAINSIAGDEADPRFNEAAQAMSTVNMDKVDIIIIMYDSTDYNNGTPSDNPNNPYDITAFTGGLRISLENIKKTWPYIRIFVMSPTYAQYMDEDGNLHNGTTTDLGNGTLNHYLVKEVDAVMDCGVSIIDNYYGTINEDNYQDYMQDHMRYNDAGRELLAARVADIINNHMGTVTSTANE